MCNIVNNSLEISQNIKKKHTKTLKKVKFFEHNNNIFLPTNSHKNQTKKGSKSNYVFRCSRCHFRFRPDDRPDAGWQRPRPSPTRGWCSRCNHELNIVPPSIKLFSSPGHGTTACLTVGRTNHMNRSKNTQGSRALDSLEFSWLNWSLWKRMNERTIRSHYYQFMLEWARTACFFGENYAPSRMG